MKIGHVVLLILLCCYTSAFNQILRKQIRNYGPEITRSGEYAVSVAIDHNGLPYFGTEKGVLVFRGDRWRSISLKDESGVRSLEYDTIRNRLWVGGAATFGYLTCDNNQQYRYVSISDSIIKQHPFKQVWQIIPEADKVTFMTNEAHYEWRESGLTWKDLQMTFIYLVDGQKYYSQKKGVFSIEENGSMVKVWDQAKIREAVYFITPLDSVNHLLFTPYDGVFRYNRKQRKVFPYDNPLNTFLKEHAFYDGYRVSDSVVAIGTWYDGLLLSDLNGNIFDTAGTVNGMTSNGISDMSLDPFGKLWIATEYGVTQIDMTSAWPGKISSKRKPYVYPMQVTINNDSTIYFDCLDQTVVLNRKPLHLTFNMSAPGFDIEYGRILVWLDGVDKEWTPISHFEKEYSQLTNGDYSFRVKLEGEPDEVASASINISIHEPWYQPLSAFWPYIVMILIFGVVLIFVLTYRFRVSKRLLTHLVDEKTKTIEGHKVELLKMNENLKQVNEELDILLYRSSHDLISPVKSVKGLLNLIKISPNEQAMYMELMEDRIVRLENILTELNSYIKNIKAESILTHEYFKQLCSDVWQEMEFMDTAVKIDMQINVADDLVFKCDRNRLKVVINNLIGNSIKYADLRKAKPFIAVYASYEDNQFVIQVMDNGRGIRPEHQARLFEMFYRANEGTDGIGLGLYLVKKIVDSLKGTIRIESEFMQWTRVEIRLPISK